MTFAHQVRVAELVVMWSFTRADYMPPCTRTHSSMSLKGSMSNSEYIDGNSPHVYGITLGQCDTPGPLEMSTCDDGDWDTILNSHSEESNSESLEASQIVDSVSECVGEIEEEHAMDTQADTPVRDAELRYFKHICPGHRLCRHLRCNDSYNILYSIAEHYMPQSATVRTPSIQFATSESGKMELRIKARHGMYSISEYRTLYPDVNREFLLDLQSKFLTAKVYIDEQYDGSSDDIYPYLEKLFQIRILCYKSGMYKKITDSTLPLPMNNGVVNKQRYRLEPLEMLYVPQESPSLPLVCLYRVTTDESRPEIFDSRIYNPKRNRQPHMQANSPRLRARIHITYSYIPNENVDRLHSERNAIVRLCNRCLTLLRTTKRTLSAVSELYNIHKNGCDMRSDEQVTRIYDNMRETLCHGYHISGAPYRPRIRPTLSKSTRLVSAVATSALLEAGRAIVSLDANAKDSQLDSSVRSSRLGSETRPSLVNMGRARASFTESQAVANPTSRATLADPIAPVTESVPYVATMPVTPDDREIEEYSTSSTKSGDSNDDGLAVRITSWTCKYRRKVRPHSKVLGCWRITAYYENSLILWGILLANLVKLDVPFIRHSITSPRRDISSLRVIEVHVDGCDLTRDAIGLILVDMLSEHSKMCYEPALIWHPSSEGANRSLEL